MYVQEAEGWHSCCVLILQFGVLVLVGVGGVVSWLCLLFARVEGSSLLGGQKSLGFRTGAGAGRTQKHKLHWVLPYFQFRCASLALATLCMCWLATWQSRSTTLVQTEISQKTTGWIAMKWWTDIHGSQTVYPTDFYDPLTFLLAQQFANLLWHAPPLHPNRVDAPWLRCTSQAITFKE